MMPALPVQGVTLRIGIDFDNTLAGYGHAFSSVARRWKLIPENFAGGKSEIRNAIRRLENGETEWRRLQGFVYGKGMPLARLADGSGLFLQECHKRGVPVFIVSHKTEFGHYDPERVNLRKAAQAWMKDAGFFDKNGFGILKSNVYFESTREEKIRRIRALKCSHFIDDLEEIFRDPHFPSRVKAYLYAPGAQQLPGGPFRAFRHWADIRRDLFRSHS